jgi:hypothetical protein
VGGTGVAVGSLGAKPPQALKPSRIARPIRMSVFFRFTLSPPSRDHMTAILFYLFAEVLGSCSGDKGRIQARLVKKKNLTIG